MSEYQYPIVDVGYALDWEDTIENDSTFSLVPEGDYNFKVTKFERQRYTPAADKTKGILTPCPIAVLTIEVWNAQGQKTSIIHQLFLHSHAEGMLCEFFCSIGQRKKGDPLKPNWNTVIGSTGVCRVYVNKYKDKNNNEQENNKIKRFYAKDDPAHQPIPTPSSAPAYTYQQTAPKQPQQPQQPAYQQPKPQAYQQPVQQAPQQQAFTPKWPQSGAQYQQPSQNYQQPAQPMQPAPGTASW